MEMFLRKQIGTSTLLSRKKEVNDRFLRYQKSVAGS